MESIKPEKAQQMLKQAGLEVTIEQAAKILEFLNNLAEISIAVYLTPQSERPPFTNS